MPKGRQTCEQDQRRVCILCSHSLSIILIHLKDFSKRAVLSALGLNSSGTNCQGCKIHQKPFSAGARDPPILRTESNRLLQSVMHGDEEAAPEQISEDHACLPAFQGCHGFQGKGAQTHSHAPRNPCPGSPRKVFLLTTSTP